MTAFLHYFRASHTKKATHKWSKHDHDVTVCLSSALAYTLADAIVELRCKRCRSHYDAWKIASQGGPRPVGHIRAGLEAWLGAAFGLPNTPLKPVDHLQGFVAEHLWYFFMHDLATQEGYLRIEAPGFKATDPGGDGLVIHRRRDGRLGFCLWEIKKASGKKKAGTTINRAIAQLSSNAIGYLARYSASSDPLPNAEQEAFYGRLIEHWANGSEQASAGVSVVTSTHLVPKQCFEQFPKTFPSLTSPPRLNGLLTTVGDLAQFTFQVRDSIWSGL